MIQHILKIIWAERKINLWILLELMLVFCILWFCTDYLAFMFKRAMEPKGFDIEHTYLIRLGEKANEKAMSNDEKRKNLWIIYDRVKQYPAIESSCYSFVSHPYSGSWHGDGSWVDSIMQEGQKKYVMQEFFDVYKIDFLSGKGFDASNSLDESNIIISADADNLFAKKQVGQIDSTKNYDKTRTMAVVGAVAKTKRDEYAKYNAVVYFPINNMNYLLWGMDFSVRVKPEADKDFEKKFMADMASQFEVGRFYLSGVESGESARSMHFKMNNITDNFRSIYSIISFLVFNIFLGVIGTFWFRIQTRRSEIGLRVALGASKANVRKMFIMETVILLFLASIVATIICINIGLADTLKDMGLPIAKESEGNTVRYVTNFGLTFGFIAIIAILGAWYPAQKASEALPAEALRDQ